MIYEPCMYLTEGIMFQAFPWHSAGGIQQALPNHLELFHCLGFIEERLRHGDLMPFPKLQ